MIHLQIDEDMTARISMADAKFSFQCPGRMYSPAWMAPEGIYSLFSSFLSVEWFSWCLPGVLLMLQDKNKLSDLSSLIVFFVALVLSSALQKRPEDINRRSADMWSFSVLLWELVTREVPFADLSHMEIGMKVRGCII